MYSEIFMRLIVACGELLDRPNHVCEMLDNGMTGRADDVVTGEFSDDGDVRVARYSRDISASDQRI